MTRPPVAVRADPAQRLPGHHPPARSAGPPPSGPQPAGTTVRPGAPGATVRPGAPGTTARGERFLRTLRHHRPEAARSLPVQVRRLAELVVGPGVAARVQIRTGPATRAALAEAGRPAVTVGNVIHVAAAPDGSARSAEVLAHELVHAARPSPVPRFFDDDHRSGEEAEARRTGGRVAALVRAFEARVEAGARSGTSHLAWGTSGLAVGPGASPLTMGAVGQLLAASGSGSPRQLPAVEPPGGGRGTTHRPRRSGRHRPGGPGEPGGPGSEWGGPDGPGEPPAEWMDSLPPAVAAIVRRGGTGGFPTSPAESAGRPDRSGPFAGGDASGPESLRRGSGILGGAMSPTARPTAESEVPYVQQPGAPISSETIDWIVEAVEERVLAELERRGMRFHPGVF